MDAFFFSSSWVTAIKPFIAFVKSSILDLTGYTEQFQPAVSGTTRFFISFINLGFFELRKSTDGEVALLGVIIVIRNGKKSGNTGRTGRFFFIT